MYRRRARRKRHKSVADWSVEKSARGGSRTHMRKNPRRILSPQRLPFRHPGKAENKEVITSSLLGAPPLSPLCPHSRLLPRSLPALAQSFEQHPPSQPQKDVVPVKYTAGLMAAYPHRYDLGNSSTNHITHRTTSNREPRALVIPLPSLHSPTSHGSREPHGYPSK